MRESTDKKRNGRRASGLVALSSAAVLAVYAAGYARTRSAAQRLADEVRRPRPVVHGAADAGSPVMPEPPAASVPAPVAAPAARPAEQPVAPQAAEATRRPGSQRSTSTVKAASAKKGPAKTSADPLAPIVAAPALPLMANAVPGSTEIPLEPPPPAQSQYKDGTYSGWGSCRHGDIEATVVIASGRIASARISRCLTRYSCSWIAALPPEVVSRQSPEVDYVSGATQSTNAFYWAVVEALSKAK